MLRLRKSISALFLGATLLAFFCVDHIQAQSILDGKLTGTITDDTGEPLPGVTVEVTSPALITGKRSTLTSDKGVYVFLHLPVGRYDLKASLQGFKSAVQTAIHISAGSSVVVNLTMAPGAIEEEVTVTAVSPVVDARTSAISTNIESDLLDKMPTSRDPFSDNPRNGCPG